MGITICPGVGFDVIPTDCIATSLKQALPDACYLLLGFESKSPLSPGTSKTAIEGLPRGGKIRSNGFIIPTGLAAKTRMIDFGQGMKLAMTIPWGDISTAYFSTQIPNIEVYIPTNKKQVTLLRCINPFRSLLGFKIIQDYLKKCASSQKGPDAKQRHHQHTWVWGEATTPWGQHKTARVKTTNGYDVTINGSLFAVDFMNNNSTLKPGYTTPALLMGSDVISKLNGCGAIEITD